jgi:osmotically-inducible protein OsmY
MPRTRKDIGPGHLAGQLNDALAEDPRLHVLDIQVQVIEGRVHLHGQVGSEQLKQYAEAIAREISEGMPIVCRLQVIGEPAHAPRDEQIR